MSSIEKDSEERPSGGMILDAVFANRSTSKFCNLRKELILKSWKELVISLTNF